MVKSKPIKLCLCKCVQIEHVREYTVPFTKYTFERGSTIPEEEFFTIKVSDHAGPEHRKIELGKVYEVLIREPD